MIVGSFEDISKEGSYEFANGSEPTEMSHNNIACWGKLLDIFIKQQLIFFVSSWNLKYVVLNLLFIFNVT